MTVANVYPPQKLDPNIGMEDLAALIAANKESLFEFDLMLNRRTHQGP
jgi:hypothetical protein